MGKTIFWRILGIIAISLLHGQVGKAKELGAVKRPSILQQCKEQQQMPVECQQNCHFDRLMALDDELAAKLVVTLTTLECPLLTPFGQLI